jgi:hypothetical protein
MGRGWWSCLDCMSNVNNWFHIFHRFSPRQGYWVSSFIVNFILSIVFQIWLVISYSFILLMLWSSIHKGWTLYKCIVVLLVSKYKIMILIEFKPLTNNHVYFGYRYEFRMNMKTGKVTQKQLSTLTTEFPEINDKYTGR